MAFTPPHVYPASSYNDYGWKISIGLDTVFDNAQSMQTDLDTIENAWNRTMTIWNALKLSWVGKTQTEVTDFQAEIDHVHNEVFGTSKQDPAHPTDPTKQLLDQPGLYQQVKDVALGATQNYFYTDVGVWEMFTKISANITDTSSVLVGPLLGLTLPGLGPIPFPVIEPDGSVAAVSPDPKPAPGKQADNSTLAPITETF